MNKRRKHLSLVISGNLKQDIITLVQKLKRCTFDTNYDDRYDEIIQKFHIKQLIKSKVIQDHRQTPQLEEGEIGKMHS